MAESIPSAFEVRPDYRVDIHRRRTGVTTKFVARLAGRIALYQDKLAVRVGDAHPAVAG